MGKPGRNKGGATINNNEDRSNVRGFIVGSQEIVLALIVVMFGWVFYRTNSNNQKSEDVRRELSDRQELVRLELTKQIEGMRLEYVDKVAKLHDEDRDIRKETSQSVTDVGNRLSAQIKELNVWPKPDVIEWVGSQLSPIAKGLDKLEVATKDQAVSNAELAKEVGYLLKQKQE